MRNATILSMALFAGLAASPPARADFRIVLRDGGVMVAESYQVRGEKLLVYRSTGMVEIDRARVESIREDASEDQAASPLRARPEAPADSPRQASVGHGPAAAAGAAPSAAVSPEDTSAGERQLTRQIILANRDLLFAENRGEDKAAIEKRKKEITRLEGERKELHKQTTSH